MENHPSKWIIGDWEWYELENCRSQQTIQMGELSQSANFNKFNKLKTAKPAWIFYSRLFKILNIRTSLLTTLNYKVTSVPVLLDQLRLYIRGHNFLYPAPVFSIQRKNSNIVPHLIVTLSFHLRQLRLSQLKLQLLDSLCETGLISWQLIGWCVNCFSTSFTACYLDLKHNNHVV